MKVRELIDKLELLPADMDVIVDDYPEFDVYVRNNRVLIDAIESEE